jgi:hypothetical protein
VIASSRRYLLLAALFLAAAPAFAQSAADVERAKESFKAGAAAYAAGEYLAAIQALDAAYALTPLPAIAFSLAQAERKQYFVRHDRQHLERAIRLFRSYVEQVQSGGRRADALDALSQLEPLATGQEKKSEGRVPVPNAAERARSTRLVITSDTPRARLSLDGSPPLPSPLIREVEPGKHRVLVEAQGFYSVQRELTALTGELTAASIPLRERPSTLVLWTAEDAEIYLDGVFVSEGGEGVSLKLASGFHDLAVARKGHKVASRQLLLERGGTERLRIALEPTRLRIASQVLFISGGAALSASLLLSALAIRAENRTEDFLARRKHDNVTNPELVSYRTAVANRDRYRAAATISVASSVAVFVTGVFLHELDQPTPQQLLRRTRGPSRRPGANDKAALGLDLLPVLVPGNYGGALLQGTF